MRTLTAYIEYDEETRLYVGIIPGIPGAHSQGKTLDELNYNLKEVIDLCMEENPESIRHPELVSGAIQFSMKGN